MVHIDKFWLYTQILLDPLLNALSELCQPIKEAIRCFHNMEARNIGQEEREEKLTEMLIYDYIFPVYIL